MIIFKSISFKNIFSVGNSLVSFQLNKTSNTLFYGKSGSGKSTLIDAITFALYGHAYRDITKKLLVNSINKKGLYTEIEFNNYKVIRGMSPNIFEIYKDGVLVPQRADVRDYQRYLEVDVLKMSFKTFKQIVILGTAAFEPFMKLPAKTRRDVIEDLLDLQIFSKMDFSHKNCMSETQKDIISVGAQQDASKSLIRSLEAAKEAYTSSDEEKLKKIDNKINDLETHFSQVLTQTKNDHISNIEKLNNEIQSQPVTIDKANQLLSKNTSEIANRKAERDLYLKNNKFLHDHVSCPTCKQDINSDHKDKLTTESNQLIKLIDNDLADLQVKADKLNKFIKKVSDLYNQLNDEKRKLQINEHSIKNNRERIQELIQTKSEMMQLDTKNHIQDQDVIDAEKQKITDLNSKYDELNTYFSNQKIVQGLLKDSGIKSVIINKYIPLLNKRINHYLNLFDLFISFELDSEFNETIKARHKDEFQYNSFSEGQKKRIDFSILLAFRDLAKSRNSSTSNLLIIDELLDGLDNDNIDNMEVIVRGFEGTNTIFISHNDDLKNKNMFEKCYKTEQQAGFTVYTEV